MGIFSSPQSVATAPASSSRRRSDGPGVSIIAPDLTVTGDLKADGVVRVEGRVIGNLVADDQILLASGGYVEGDVHAREVVIAGEVRGRVTATGRLEIQSTAEVYGDVVTPRLLIQEGGRLNGGMRMEIPGVPVTE